MQARRPIPRPDMGLFMRLAARSNNMATGDFMAMNTPEAPERLGTFRGTGKIDPIAGTVFPNLRVWMPKRPYEMEVWTWGLVDAGVSDTVKAQMYRGFQARFGVSGLVEQDDGDQWQEVSAAAKGVRRPKRVELHRHGPGP